MTNEKPLARESGFDHTFAAVREGYMFLPNRRKSFRSDVFDTRILGRRAVCLGGKAAAELFYDEERFIRSGAAPKRVLKTLFGQNGVQTLDDQAHKHRKQMFMSLMAKEQLARLTDLARSQWELAAEEWEHAGEIELYDRAKQLLFRIACAWSGVPIWAKEVESHARDLGDMYEAPAVIGPKHRRGRQARKRMEAWAGSLITGTREGKLKPEPDTALHVIAMHKDLNGSLLDVQTAAVELLNILRPVTAVAIYVNFTALALIQHPEQKEGLLDGNPQAVRRFVQEVRRFYPFFPLAAARVRKDFVWRGHPFKKGTLALLDLYGTNHDPELWDNPERFDPDRFTDWKGSPFSFIPQGGGDYWLDHRCPGEWMTIELMTVSVEFLAKRLAYEVPQQDLSYSMVNIPSMPKSRVVLRNIRRV